MRVDKFKDSTALQGILTQSILTNDKFGLGKEIGNVTTSNVTTKFREAFETYTPGQYWTEAKQGGDLIFLDGNSVGASYLVISKDPFGLGTETSLTSVVNFNMPIEASMGISLSQRTSGQEIAFELVDIGYKTGEVNWRAKGPLMHSESYVNETTGEVGTIFEQIEEAPFPLEPV